MRLWENVRRWLGGRKAWASEKLPRLRRELVFVVGGETIIATPLSASGLGLMCDYADSDGRSRHVRLLHSQHAVDKALFWRDWRELGGGPLTFEDGTVFDPSEEYR